MLKRMFLVINLSVLVFFGMSSPYSKFNSGDVKHITKFRLMQENIIDYKEDFVKWKRKL